MCGIFGRWNTHGAQLDLEHVEAATQSLRHRGPDDEGYLAAHTRRATTIACAGRDTDPRVGLPLLRSLDGDSPDLAFGFRRLSIVDLSPAGHQPMGTEDGRYWLVFNGEIYNHEALRNELIGQGHSFRGRSDTEVLLAALRATGRSAFSRCNGMWAVAFWDRDRRSLLLCRDRFGVKPLFYSFEDGVFSFASEAKALVGAHGRRFATDDAVIASYLETGALPEPIEGATFFGGIRSLPPGHWLEVKDGTLTIERYYDLPLGLESTAKTEQAIVAEYRALLEDSVRLRLHADVPVGSCLSGGLDSSAIVCLTSNLLPADRRQDAQKTFSAVYRDGGAYDEEAFMQRVIGSARTDAHFVVPTVDRLVSELDRIVWHQDEPFTSTSIFAQWCLMSSAHDAGVTVLLDGQGADEPLGGYRPFDRHLSDLMARGALVSAVREAVAANRINGLAIPSLAGRAVAHRMPSAGRAWLRRRRDARTVSWSARSLVRAVPTEPDDSSLDGHLRALVGRHSLPHLLRYEDRNSMAFSIEARVPFVDYRVVEYAFTHGAALRMRDGWTKWLLRRAMLGTVPDEIVWRRDKVGFDTPERKWMDAVIPAFRTRFDDPRSERFLDIDRVRSALASWPTTSAEPRRVWRWINLESWLRCWS